MSIDLSCNLSDKYIKARLNNSVNLNVELLPENAKVPGMRLQNG